MKKRNTDNYRKRSKDDAEPVKADCNGGVSISQSQRSDHIPLLVNTNRKRWHSLEMVRAEEGDHEISGCEDLVDNSKKSLGRNIIKSWLVGIFHSSNNGLKSTARNGSGILLQQQPPTAATKPDKETSIVWGHCRVISEWTEGFFKRTCLSKKEINKKCLQVVDF